MGDLWFYIFCTIVSLAFTLFAWARARRLHPLRRQLWAMDVTWGTPSEGELMIEDVPVRVAATYKERQLQALAFEWPATVGTTLELRQESLARQLTREDHLTGDQRFDDDVHVHAGDEAVAVAVLDEATRRKVRRALEAGAVFANQRWQLEGHNIGEEPLADVLALVHAAYTALQPPSGTVAELLASRARSDRRPGVRKRALEVLIRRDLADDSVLAACERDLHAMVKFVAAAGRGEGGRDTLRQLMLNGSRSFRVKAALSLGELGAGADLRAMEQALIGALDDAEHAEDAAKGLGRFGSPRVLPDLGAAVQGPATAAVRAAMEAIRARSDPAMAGSLSLAASGGELSVAHSAHSGAVGVTE